MEKEKPKWLHVAVLLARVLLAGLLALAGDQVTGGHLSGALEPLGGLLPAVLPLDGNPESSSKLCSPEPFVLATPSTSERR